MWKPSRIARLPSRKFSQDLYDPQLIEKLRQMGNDYTDSRAFDNISLKELKNRVPPDVWAKITATDPIYKMPELEGLHDIQDVKAHAHQYLPPHLSKPAVMLDERHRTAKRMTLDFIREETTLKQKRDLEFNDFTVVTSDDYELALNLMVVREPIWLMGYDREAEWSKKRYQTFKAHNLLALADSSLKPEPQDSRGMQKERDILIRETEEKLEAKQYVELPIREDSTHYLEANPNEQNPHKIAYAGGYRVWLMLKNKATGKWEFPNSAMKGGISFEETKKKVVKSLGTRMKVHHLGPKPVGVSKHPYSETQKRTRPTYFMEDVYSLYLRRLQIMFPRSKEEDLVAYLGKKYDLYPVQEPKVREVKGKKVLYFRSIYMGGSVLVDSEAYEDYAWVPKVHLNKYVDEADYNNYVQLMTRF